MRLNINTIVTKLWKFTKENPWVIVIFAVAVSLRLYNFEPHLTFLGDQGRDAIIVKRIVTLEHLPLVGPPTSIGQVFLGPFYYYLIAPFLLLWNFNPVGLGYGVLILTCIGVIVSYVLFVRNQNKTAGLFFLFLFSFSSVNIAFSRFSWNPNLLPIFIFLTLYFFYRMLEKLKYVDAVIFGMLFALSLQLHYVSIALGLPFLILTIIEIVRNRKKTMLIATRIITSIISFAIFFSPLILFDLRHDFVNAQTFLKMFTQTDVVSSAHASLLQRIIETHHQFVNFIFAFQFPQPVTLIFLGLLFVYGLGYLRHRKNKLFTVYFVSFYGFLLAFSFLNSQRYEHYYGPAYYSFFAVIAILLADFLKNARKLIAFPTVGLLVLVYFCFNFNGFKFVFVEGSRRLEHAQRVAQTMVPEITDTPFQIVALPFTESSSMYRYFVERAGKTPLSEDTVSDPKQLFVLCFKAPCHVLNDAQWQIAAFSNKKIDKIWIVDGITIYKVVHGN